MSKSKLKTLIPVLLSCLALSGCFESPMPMLHIKETETTSEINESKTESESDKKSAYDDLESSPMLDTFYIEDLYNTVPKYEGDAFYILNDNKPYFSNEDLSGCYLPFEYYSDLDELGRCGVSFACIGTETMPTEERESISEVTPSGWNNKEYDFVDGGWIYNRCHLIGFQLTGENANEKNLITGTRYMNTEGMLPFENMVADYIKETGQHVLYRVTPVFYEDDLVASGVVMEAMSVEDNGEDILFNVYCYNVQPGIDIDYRTGDNMLSADIESDTDPNQTDKEDVEYILNTRSKKFHLPDCSGAENISENNKETYYGKKSELLENGYSPCGVCHP